MFKHLVLAGTFDHLHSGHSQFIRASLESCQSASLGVSLDWSKKNKILANVIQNYKTRVKTLEKFLQKYRFSQKTDIFPLENPYEPAVSNPSLDAIAVTEETIEAGRKINSVRQKNRLRKLKILMVKMAQANDNQRISSARIRLGEINRQGLVYQKILTKTLFLASKQRRYFKKPLGRLIIGSNNNISWAGEKIKQTINRAKPACIISIGDITTQALWFNKLPISLAIYDHRCQRRPISNSVHRQFKKQVSFFSQAPNRPGTINSSATYYLGKTLSSIIKTGQTGAIQIKGEEDLLVLPAVLLAPLGTFIFYGQPHQGVVQIKVTEKTKEKALKLIRKFNH